jgi:dienelactone hydrolase
MIGFAGNGFSQTAKELIDTTSYRKWRSLGHLAILSDDGLYAMYTIENKPLGGKTLMIVSTVSNWKKEVPDASVIAFSRDNKLAICSKNDKLILQKLGSDGNPEIINTINYKVVNENTSIRLIAYQGIKTPGDLILRNLADGSESKFYDVKNYELGKMGNVLLLQNTTEKGGVELKLVLLRTRKVNSFWKGSAIKNVVFDEKHHQLAFEANSGVNKIFWYYKFGDEKASVLADSLSKGLDTDSRLEGIEGFSNDGNRVFVRLTRKSIDISGRVNPNAVALNIWGYKDEKTQGAQELELGEVNMYHAVIAKNTKEITKLQNEGDNFMLDPSGNDEWAHLNTHNFISNPKTLDERYTDSYCLVSTKDGRRVGLKYPGFVSPNGKYVISLHDNNVYRFRISNQQTTKIWEGINKAKVKDNDDVFNQPRMDFVGWLEDERSFLIYDEYDIWKIACEGKVNPVNITNFYGRKNQIVFTILNSRIRPAIFKNDEHLILSTFNTSDKMNGFYKGSVNSVKDPEKLSMAPSLFWNPYGRIGIENGVPFLSRSKANNAYLIQKMTAKESPNLFVTRDFKKFKKISYVHPETDYNWVYTELHTFAKPNGDKLKGILYKPENFDPQKKYPVIFYFYRKQSDNLNAFKVPKLSDGTLNIPWYVSNGYLVFTPDITYKMGETGDNGLTAVTAAAKYVSTLPYINKKKMGIQGASFGGYQTNYIVTHSNLFAAACSAIGLFDLVSAYNSINGGVVKQGQFEYGPYQIGTTLWENPELYIKNSPIFYVDKLTTPLLIMNNPKDHTIPMSGAMEFYLASRRMGKKVWLLEYENSGHGVAGKDAEDFDLRIRQFFDHYLKDAPPPKWMTMGRPAKLKGIEERLELDTSGAIP